MTAALLSFAILAAVFWPLERLFPARRGQPWASRVLSVDTLFFFGQYLVWTGLAISVLAFLEPHLAAPDFIRSAFRAQPVLLQIAEALFLADLCVYWFHRACHRFEFLWSFHSVHHSAEQVDWLAAHREHPLDGILTHAVINLPVLMLGVPLSWLAGLVAFRGLWAIFVHSNVSLPLGLLRFLFGAPQLHRWHHAREGMGRHNFANLAPYMDLLFGTFHEPRGEETWSVGLAEPFPKGYVGQLLHPFKPVLLASLLFVSCGVPGPKLKDVPDCGTVTDGGASAELFNDVLQNTVCSASGCHAAPMPVLFDLAADGTTLRGAWVAQKSTQVKTMNRVTPGNADESYVVYKLMGQQVAAGGSGERMPVGALPLTDAELCRVIGWIQTGAR